MLTVVSFNEKFNAQAYDHMKHEPKKLLTSENYEPRGKTALYDAIGCSINAYLWEPNNILVIISNGLDNASSIFTGPKIKTLVEDVTDRWTRWIIQYYGGNQAVKEATKEMGLRQGEEHNSYATRWNNNSKSLRRMLKKVGRKLRKAIEYQRNRRKRVGPEGY